MVFTPIPSGRIDAAAAGAHHLIRVIQPIAEGLFHSESLVVFEYPSELGSETWSCTWVAL